jgi:hypothetical protein
MKLFFDKHDLVNAKKLRDERFTWLRDLGAMELSEASQEEAGFLFGYDQGSDHYQRLVGDRPNVRDRPAERDELNDLRRVLERLIECKVEIPTPRTWVIGIDDSLPDDLEFPVFVRTPKSSWKRGGAQSRADNQKELIDEMSLLRRGFTWETPILARQWIDVAPAGKWMFGDAPQEIRVWIVDRRPQAWSFHYLHVVPDPEGFPPDARDLSFLKDYATRVGAPFRSRLIAADFVKDRRGKWHFLEACPGAVAGTAHEEVFKLVAQAVRGDAVRRYEDTVGGSFDA